MSQKLAGSDLMGHRKGTKAGWPTYGERARVGGLELRLTHVRKARQAGGRLIAEGQAGKKKVFLACKPLLGAKEERHLHRFLIEWIEVQAPEKEALNLLVASIQWLQEVVEVSPRFRPEPEGLPEKLERSPTLYLLPNRYLLAATVGERAHLAYAPLRRGTLLRKPGAYPGHWTAQAMLGQNGRGVEPLTEELALEVEYEVKGRLKPVVVKGLSLLVEGTPLWRKRTTLPLPYANWALGREEVRWALGKEVANRVLNARWEEAVLEAMA